MWTWNVLGRGRSEPDDQFARDHVRVTLAGNKDPVAKLAVRGEAGIVERREHRLGRSRVNTSCLGNESGQLAHVLFDDENPADLIQLDPGNLLARRDKRPLLLYLSVSILDQRYCKVHSPCLCRRAHCHPGRQVGERH